MFRLQLLFLCLLYFQRHFMVHANPIALPVPNNCLNGDICARNAEAEMNEEHNHLTARELVKRSSFSIGVCRGIRVRPAGGAIWRFDSAFCNRVGQQGSRTAYVVQCAASNDQGNTREVEGDCPANTKCIQRSGFNEFADPVTDIVCVPNDKTREWVVNGAQATQSNTIDCSAGFNNVQNGASTFDIVTNVYDSNFQNLISPSDNYFEISQVRVGKSSSNAIADSGNIVVKAHGAVQACVQAKVNQILMAISGQVN